MTPIEHSESLVALFGILVETWKHADHADLFLDLLATDQHTSSLITLRPSRRRDRHPHEGGMTVVDGGDWKYVAVLIHPRPAPSKLTYSSLLTSTDITDIFLDLCNVED